MKTLTGDPAPNLAARISYVAAPSNGAIVAREGLAERLSDLLIYDSGSGAACFQNGNVITFTYAAALAGAPGIDVFDTAGTSGLAVTAQLNGSSVVRLTVTHAGTAGNLVSATSGSAVRIKNLRANVSTISLGLNVTVQGSATATGTLSGSLRNVGYVVHTIATGAAIGSTGSGAQNAGGTLSHQATFSFAENFADALRVRGTSGVSGDITTGSTSLIFDVSNSVPPGVTLTFPPAIVTAGLSFSLRAGGTCSGPVQCFAIYDTTANASGNGSVTIMTAAVARTGADGSLPAIGVQIGEMSGMGTIMIRAMLGPGSAGDVNDDVNAAAVPRYVATNTPGADPTRAIFGGPWFTIVPGSPVLALSSRALAFGSMLVGTGKEATVTLSNTSSQVLQFGSITLSGADFRLDNGCPMLLAPFTSCVLSVYFAPTSAVPRSGAITIVSSAPGSPHVIALTGEGQVVSAVPVLTSLSPPNAQAGSGWTRLVVNGSNFAAGAVVQWNGVGLGTSVLSHTQLAAGIPPEALVTAGEALITVSNPPPGGGISLPLKFTIFAGPLPAKPYLYYVPHVVSGGGYSTRFTLVDLGFDANNVSLNYIAQSGALAGGSTFTLPVGGTLRIETPPADRVTPVISQWAVLGADAPLAVHVIVEHKPVDDDAPPANSVGFGDCTPSDSFAIPAEFEPAPATAAVGRTMGLAIANPSPAAITIELRLVDSSGTAMADYGLTLPPFGHTALDLQQIDAFRAVLPPANFVGSITGVSTAPVCALALLDNYGPFIVAPVARKPR